MAQKRSIAFIGQANPSVRILARVLLAAVVIAALMLPSPSVLGSISYAADEGTTSEVETGTGSEPSDPGSGEPEIPEGPEAPLPDSEGDDSETPSDTPSEGDASMEDGQPQPDQGEADSGSAADPNGSQVVGDAVEGDSDADADGDAEADTKTIGKKALKAARAKVAANSYPKARSALTDEQLAPFVVPGLDPDSTTINLFDYDTGCRGTGANAGTDTLGSTGAASPQVNYQTWLDKPGSINYGHLLTFGDGMRHLGYWNQGIVAGYGEVARERPGMQNIVQRTLNASGYPAINNTAADSGISTGYNGNPEVYSTATRKVGSYIEAVYYNAGPDYSAGYNGNIASIPAGMHYPVQAKNITDAVQTRASGGGTVGALTADQLSLQYLFDPNTTVPGKTSYKDVGGLFQIDGDGYYYYNMRKNFAEYDADTNRFVLYDQPAGLRTDNTDSVGNFFPFNSAANAFKIEDGKLVNAMRADNNNNPNITKPEQHPEVINSEPVNHHLGMTLETDFRQPINGTVGNGDMTFEFTGDDDVWVFVDDVLVLDMGGIHSEVYGTINFSTGDVNIGTAYNSNGEIFNADGSYITAPVIKTNLREQFEAAGQADNIRWNGNTFASSTSHTLKMFYLERGNYDSSISVQFNLQPALYQQIKKVDQDGNPLAGAEFDLYAVEVPAGTNAQNAKDVTLDQVSVRGGALTHVVTNDNGEAKFTDPTTRDIAQPEPFNFSDRYDGGSEGLLYILRESKTPPGYKSLPTDLLLRFDPANTMLIVNNRYQSGAYASFNSYVTGNTDHVYYGQIGADGGAVSKIPDDELLPGATATVPITDQKDGLVVAVPMLKQSNYGSQRAWFPLYGDNLVGFKTLHIGDTDGSYEEYRRTVRVNTLTCALLQAAEHYRSESGQDNNYTEGWYLGWDTKTNRLKGTLQNLPGRADRYLLNNNDGDMRMFYGIIEPDALARVLGVSRSEVAAMTPDQRYAALGRIALSALTADGDEPGNRVQSLVQLIGAASDLFQERGYSALDISEFVRNFRSLLYIPNERRQLRVTKIDQNGVARNGAQFSIFASEADAKAGTNAVASGTTATVQGMDGMVIFEPLHGNESGLAGYADVKWPNVSFESGTVSYYLKETRSPAGCELNPTIVPVKVGVYSIYADAGTADDGVSVSAGVGTLMQTMVKYASDGDVNITLRDITAFAQSQPSDGFGLQKWEDVLLSGTGSLKIPRSMNLHYGKNAVVDYGLSDEDGGENIMPFFVTDTGYIRARVQQNLHAHDDPNDPEYSLAQADDLGDMDITSLFSLLNTVIVTDHDNNAPAAGRLMVSKTVDGSGVTTQDYTTNFHFQIRFYGKGGTELDRDTRFYYYGRDRMGYVASGDTLPIHHDESLTILGIPAGCTYSVTETDGNQNGLYVTPVDGLFEGSVRNDTVSEAAFVNTRGERPPDGNPGNPGEPGGPDSGGGDGNGEGWGLPQLGDTLPWLPLLFLALGAAAVAVYMVYLKRDELLLAWKIRARRH